MAPFVVAILGCIALGLPAGAQTFKVIHDFACGSGGGGNRPTSCLVLDGDLLYGTTSDICGGENGTVFKIKTDGTGFTMLRGSGLGQPNGLALSSHTLYGTSKQGDNGSGLGLGTVFSIETNGSNYTVLKSFSGPDGRQLWAGVVVAGDTLYGTTEGGGSIGGGTVFKLNTNGSGFAVLHNFTWSSTNPTGPGGPMAEVTLAGDTLYGTANYGGAGLRGVVFRLGTDGSGFTVLHEFGNAGEGTNPGPNAPLVIYGDTIYGTTESGGAGGGVVFKMNTNGNGYVVLQSFQASGGNRVGRPLLRGNTLFGTHSAGSLIYKVNTDGSGYAPLHIFYNYADGNSPWAGLVARGNRFYGVNDVAGSLNGGTLFEFQYPDTPVISKIIKTNGAVNITWNSTMDASYRVQYASQPAGTNWMDLSGTIAGSGSTLSFTDTAPPDTQRFYRIVLLVP